MLLRSAHTVSAGAGEVGSEEGFIGEGVLIGLNPGKGRVVDVQLVAGEEGTSEMWKFFNRRSASLVTGEEAAVDEAPPADKGDSLPFVDTRFGGVLGGDDLGDGERSILKLRRSHTAKQVSLALRTEPKH